MKLHGKAYPDCINASNPYHECVDYCLQKIAEARAGAAAEQEVGSKEKPPADRTVHPDCVNARNPYHECNDFCFRQIAEAKDRTKTDARVPRESDSSRLLRKHLIEEQERMIELDQRRRISKFNLVPEPYTQWPHFSYGAEELKAESYRS